MAHFAELDDNNTVVNIMVTDNAFPQEGYEWLMEVFGGTWVQTSYNARIRGKFATIGDTYDETIDEFVPADVEGPELVDPIPKEQI